MEVFFTKRDIQDRFQVFFLKYYQEMVRFAYSYTREPAIAEDLVQDIFIQLWVKRRDSDRFDSSKSFLLLCVKNKCLNYLRHRQVEGAHLQQSREQIPVEYVDEENALEEAICKLLDRIPSKRRKILELCILESRSYQEIAVLLGISQNTVKAHLKRAYAFLREEIKNAGIVE